MSYDHRVDKLDTKDELARAVAESRVSPYYKGDIILATHGKGWVVPSLITGDAATYSQTANTITVTSTGHGMTAAQNGRDVYLQFSSGLAVTGWFSNFTYIDANSFSCTSTVSQTTSGGCSTNLSNIIIPESICILPGGLLGANGGLNVSALLTCTSSAAAKRFRFTSGSDVWVQKSGINVTSFGVTRILKNRNAENKQTSVSVGTTQEYVPNSTNVNIDYAINTAGDVANNIAIGCAAASEFVCLEHFEVFARKSL